MSQLMQMMVIRSPCYEDILIINVPQKELIELIPFRRQTRGKDICQTVLDCLKDKEIVSKYLVPVATYGALTIKGIQNGFMTRRTHKLLPLHHEAFCAKTIAKGDLGDLSSTR